MKRIFILVVVTLLAVGSAFAEESTLIDFSKLKADTMEKTNLKTNNVEPTQNLATLMDFTNEATGNFTSRQKQVMNSSLAITNWDVVFSSSSRNIVTKERSYTKEAISKGAFADDDGEEKTVMGVRIHFPTEPFNSSATIKPPFSIPAFQPQVEVEVNEAEDSEEGNEKYEVVFTEKVDDNGKPLTKPTRFEGEADEDGKATGGLGLIKNVGTIKSIAVNVRGLNFPHALYVILIDDKGVEKNYFMGYLNFEEWGELRWDNPQYIHEVRNRELRADPVYPDSTPYVKFGGFLIQKQANVKGGDFIVYFKDVKVIYDKAVLEEGRDIDDEDTWNIIQERDTDRRKVDLQRLGQIELQRTLDRQRQALPNETFGKRPDQE